MNAAAFFDQVLDHLELGFPAEAIGRLMVMLDLAVDDSANLGNVRAALRAHPLSELLERDPVVAAAAQGDRGDRINRMVSLIDSGLAGAGSTKTTAVLANALAESAFYRSVRARVRHSSAMLNQAWQAGRSIAVLGGTFQSEFASLIGRDLSNLTIAEVDASRTAELAAHLGASATIVHGAPAAFLDAAARSCERFDLIYFPRVLESADAAQAAALFARAARVMAPGGSIVAPGFLANRIGRGWQQVCLDWQVRDHAATALDAAMATGLLTGRTISDSAGCFAWRGMARATGNHQRSQLCIQMGGNLER